MILHALVFMPPGLTYMEDIMLQWALTFLVVALIAAVLGFGGVAAISIELARIVFAVFLVLFVVAAITHMMTGKKPPLPPV